MQNRRLEHLTLWMLCLVALVLRLYRLDECSLWFDEIFGATFAAQNFVDMTIAELRFDIHPPFWYVQLFLWAGVDHHDYWLLLNSVLWSVAGVATIYITSKPVFGSRIALAAAALLAVAPISVMYAQFVRMYAMLTVLVPLAWYFNHAYLTGRQGRAALWWLIGLELLIAYSHGVGVMIVFYLVVYGMLLPGQSQVVRQRYRAWLIAQGCVGVLSLGGVANGLVRKVAHTPAPDFGEFINTLISVWFGPLWADSAPIGCLALVLTLAPICGALLFRRGRAVVLGFVLAPLMTGILVSYTIKPMWHVHALVFASPFYMLSLVLLIRNALWFSGTEDGPGRAKLAMGISVLTLAGFTWFSVDHLQRFEKGTDYAWVASVINRQAKPGDAVYIPLNFDFWGVARYYVGPDWGSPLAVQDLELPQDRWGQLLSRMGPDWRRRLRLEPERCFIQREQVKLYVGKNTQSRIIASRPKRIFFVQTRQRDVPEVDGYRPVEDTYRNDVHLVVFESA